MNKPELRYVHIKPVEDPECENTIHLVRTASTIGLLGRIEFFPHLKLWLFDSTRGVLLEARQLAEIASYMEWLKDR